MRTQRRDLSIIIALGIIIGALAASQARAEIRVNARVRIPGGVVRVTSGSCCHHDVVRTLPARRLVRHKITRHDRKVAGRLARYTGAEKRDILELRHLGHDWTEIGMWLALPRRTVRAAQHADTWARLVKRQTRLNRYRTPAHQVPNQRRDIDDRDRRW